MEKFIQPRRADELIDRGVAFLLELVDGRDVLLLAPRFKLRRAERALVVAEDLGENSDGEVSHI